MGGVRKFRIQILLADHLLQGRPPLGLVLFPETVLGIGLEVQEVGTDRTIAVLETRQDDTVFHLGHLGAGADQQAVGRAGRPRRIPGTAGTLAD